MYIKKNEYEKVKTKRHPFKKVPFGFRYKGFIVRHIYFKFKR